MSSIITIKNLKKEFIVKQKKPGFMGSLKSLFNPDEKTILAINNISIDIEEGEILGFIGPNGAGKSTTIKILSGILWPTSGDIRVLGVIPWKERKKLAYQIGTVFGQKQQLWYHLPASETFDLFSKIYDIPEAEYRKRLDYLVKRFEIQEYLNTPVRKLSLGQRMRCEIVAALLHKPRILFLDEPTIGLDIIAKQKIRELIKEINKTEKTTIFLTSHDTQDIENLCRRVIIINHGKLIYDGSIREMNSKLHTKTVSIKFENNIDDADIRHIRLKGLKIIKYAPSGMKLEVDTKKTSLKNTLTHILKHYPVEDINISDPPIEETIKKLYMKK